MLKKRIIFTLIYKEGFFMLSRNFRLQKIGDLGWLQRNYNFSQISHHIDELCILNVSENLNSYPKFIETIKLLSNGCFVPITVGGGIRSYTTAKECFESGADKIILNSSLFENPALIEEIANDYGQQAIVGSLDFIRDEKSNLEIQQKKDNEIIYHEISVSLKNLNNLAVGEWYLNSVNRDGTGQGLDLEIINRCSQLLDSPLIISGGVGNANHIAEGLENERVSAVATANLLNFVGDGLKKARSNLVGNGLQLATWQEFT